MGARLRRALLIILIIFVIYAVINDPTTSADKTGSVWDWLKDGVDNIATFFDELIQS